MSYNSEDLAGKGFGWPLEVDGNGSISLIGGPKAFEQSIRTILGTAKGERVMRPEFGCAIWDLLFAPITTNNLGLMEDAVADAIGQWEPRVTVEEVEATQRREGSVFISVSYLIRETNDRRNLVYPFYVIPGEVDNP